MGGGGGGGRGVAGWAWEVSAVLRGQPRTLAAHHLAPPAAATRRGAAQMKFHQCVRLASFERDRTISFIPPDGAFDLM